MLLLLVALLLGCADSVQYTLGAGVAYQTHCAAQMAITGDAYEAMCTPPDCAPGYRSVGVGHVATALDPGTKVIGNAERTCVMDPNDIARSQGLLIDGKEVAPPTPTPSP